jgi:hypothetical protein
MRDDFMKKYKLEQEQIKEVNELIAQAQDNLEEVLFKLVWERDNLAKQLEQAKIIIKHC